MKLGRIWMEREWESTQLPHGTLDLQNPSNTEYGSNSLAALFIGQHMQTHAGYKVTPRSTLQRHTH